MHAKSSDMSPQRNQLRLEAKCTTHLAAQPEHVCALKSKELTPSQCMQDPQTCPQTGNCKSSTQTMTIHNAALNQNTCALQIANTDQLPMHATSGRKPPSCRHEGGNSSSIYPTMTMLHILLLLQTTLVLKDHKQRRRQLKPCNITGEATTRPLTRRSLERTQLREGVFHSDISLTLLRCIRRCRRAQGAEIVQRRTSVQC